MGRTAALEPLSGAERAAHPRSPPCVARHMHITDLLPSAEMLLGLEIEDLAAVLLETMHHPPSGYGVAEGFYVDQQVEFMRMGGNATWPQHQYRTVNNAILEAAAWLEREVLIMRDPVQRISRGGPYVLTRRGKRLRNRADVAAYREMAALPVHLLHPRIGRVAPMFMRGDLDVAVILAFRAVEIAVRGATGQGKDKHGRDLMTKAFNPKDGPLRNVEADAAEREAEMMLFSGAIGHARNPTAHREVEMDRTEAARLLLLASYLLAIVDKRRPPPDTPPPQ